MVINHVSRSWDDPPSGSIACNLLASIQFFWNRSYASRNKDALRCLRAAGQLPVILRSERHGANIAGLESRPVLKMYFLLKMDKEGIFQPVILVYWRVIWFLEESFWSGWNIRCCEVWCTVCWLVPFPKQLKISSTQPHTQISSIYVGNNS